MTKIPIITPQEAFKKLQKGGFCLDRIKGSHYVLRHPNGKQVVIPMHAGKTLKKGTLVNIIKGADLTVEMFLNL